MKGEVKYCDYVWLCGWYFHCDGDYFGDGTKETAERLYKEFNGIDQPKPCKLQGLYKMATCTPMMVSQ